MKPDIGLKPPPTSTKDTYTEQCAPINSNEHCVVPTATSFPVVCFLLQSYISVLALWRLYALRRHSKLT